MPPTRPYQVVVWGSTGFAGRLVCEHIARDYQGKGIQWAMAGRNKARLESLKHELAKIDPACEAVPILIADADDEPGLARLAAETDVIIATAGPFAKYGSKVVAAAVEAGTHYCDITGELPWVKRMIAAHHDEAKRKGVKIVHCCAYDSIPSDLGVLMLVDHARKQLGRGLSQAYGLVVGQRGAASGGTIASAFNQMETEPTRELLAQATDKYFLWPQGARKGSDKPSSQLPEWNSVANRWMAPFPMEIINSRVVQYSSLLNGLYGHDFKYREGMAAHGVLKAGLISSAVAGMGAVTALAPLRLVAKRFLPQPGEGPTREAMMNGYYKHLMIGVTEEQPGQQPQVIKGIVGDEHRDPGYWGTARMVLESGLCLALDSAACDAAGCQKGGVLTPASAMGMVLVDRLRNAGLTFEITESPALGKQKEQQADAAPAPMGRQ